MSADPVRLSAGADTPAGLRELLTQAKADLPSSAALERLAARLPLAAPISSPPPVEPTAVAASSTAKVVAAIGVAAALIGGGAWLAGRGEAPKPAQTQAVAPAVQVVEKAAPVVIPTNPAHDQQPSSTAPKPAVAGPSEASLLRQAQQALRKDPSRALALTQEHRRRFPQGALAQEREVIAIDALSRLGRSGEAGNRAKDFEKSYPGSAHQQKVRTTVEGSSP